MHTGYFSNTRFVFFQPRDDFYFTPTVRAYAAFYEPMVIGDSTSSSILLYKDQYGVTPFLVSQVTFGGPGSGANLSALAGDIQAVIDSFGDTSTRYRLSFGPYEFTGTNPVPPSPTCSLDVVYRETGASTGTCSFNLRISNNNTLVSTPKTTPQDPRWTIARDNKSATGALACNGTPLLQKFYRHSQRC